jgi:hypothetical protein
LGEATGLALDQKMFSADAASTSVPQHRLDRAKEARALAEQMNDPEAKRTMLKNADETSGSPKERENEQQDAGQSQSSCSIREIARELAAMRYTNKRGARRTRRHASKDAAIIPL